MTDRIRREVNVTNVLLSIVLAVCGFIGNQVWRHNELLATALRSDAAQEKAIDELKSVQAEQGRDITNLRAAVAALPHK